jgi:hypothetical protein
MTRQLKKEKLDYHLLSDGLEAIAEVCPCQCKKLTKSQSNAYCKSFTRRGTQIVPTFIPNPNFEKIVPMFKIPIYFGRSFEYKILS